MAYEDARGGRSGAWREDWRAIWGVHVRRRPFHAAGWILEKFHAWVDHDGDLYQLLSRDQLLTNLMLYWLPNSINASARLYYESGAAGVHATDPWTGRVDVPTGYTVYPQELMYTPRAWAERRYQLVYWAEELRGGHFAWR